MITTGRARQIASEIWNSGGWGSPSMTETECREILKFWNTLSGSSFFYEAVTRMAKGEHIEAEERKEKGLQMLREETGKSP